MIQCGVCEVVITPPLGSKLPGHFRERKMSAIKDDLYAKAMAIESDGHTVVFVVVDALFVLNREVRQIRDRIYESTQIPAEHIMVSATHTHTGPPIWHDGDKLYLSQLVVKAADAAILAYERRQPSRMGFGSGSENDIAFNRRFWMKDGTVRTNPGFQHPDLDRPTGPRDPEVFVVRIDDAQGNPLGVITNFACHPDTLGGTEACADYPGELSRTLKKVLGQQTVSLFIQGASGNINHYDFTKPKSVTANHYRKMGRILAGEVLKIREKIDLMAADKSLGLTAERVFFPITYRRPTGEEIEKARNDVSSVHSTELQRMYADRVLQILDNPEDTAEMEIQAFRMGDLAVLGLPGEIFVEFGLQLKQKSSLPYTMINTLCNGTNTGYVCTREAYEQGGYEPILRNLSRNLPETGELFVEHATELLQRLTSHWKD